MAVQKSKKSRSKRDSRRGHDSLGNPSIQQSDNDKQLYHRRHHIDAAGFYRDNKILDIKAKNEEEDAENS